MWSFLQAVVEIVLFVLAPVIVVATQIALVQLVAKLGEVQADQSSLEGRFTRRRRHSRGAAGSGAGVAACDSHTNIPRWQPITTPIASISERIVALGGNKREYFPQSRVLDNSGSIRSCRFVRQPALQFSLTNTVPDLTRERKKEQV
jgi:hypothetical protein